MTEAISVALVLIGNELLTGKIADQNGPLVISELRAVGAELTEIRVISDRVDAIRDAVQELSARNRFVVTSGGVGPTHDDVTMAAVGAAFGRKLAENSDLRDRIADVFGNDPESLRVWSRMALVPQGCDLVFEEGMVWPVHRVENVYVLPGVPQIFARQFKAVVHHFAGTPLTIATLYLNLGEGKIAEPLGSVVRDFPELEFGSYPVIGADGFRTRVTIEGGDPAQVGAATDRLMEHFGAAVVDVIRDPDLQG